ncbi:MAG: sodium:proton antiporter [Legionellales bacterium]|nr:sodium:proton antiporter [Legionellales bacterium]HAG62260.1 sodium:proton antiporter [Coxiellaceae bacterium]
MTISFLWIITGLGVITLISQWGAWWVKIPPILFLLIIGILVGPILGWFSPQVVFGHLLEPIISLSVAVILFEGSLTLSFKQIQGLESVIRNLVTLGIAATCILTSLVCHYLLHINWNIALLLGAICTISGPTVVMPMLRTISPNQKITNILRWESIAADPIGALLAIIVLTGIITLSQHGSTGFFIFSILETLIVGVGLGVLFGYLLGKALQLQWIPDFLHNVATLCIVLFAYTFASSLRESSGLLTVTLMGLWIANRHEIIAGELLGFKESLSILLISGLFILIAAQMHLKQTLSLIPAACILLITLQFIIRPISVFLCTWRSMLTIRERLFLAWVSPKGIVSASVAALFVIQLNDNQIDQANILLPLILLIIIGMVIFEGVTALPLARWLNICQPEPKGILIIGANPVAQAIGKALQDEGIQVMLTAFEWHHSHSARMAGLPIYYGNPISEHADRHLDLVGLGKLFSLSSYPDLNALASLRYAKEFGQREVYAMHIAAESEDNFQDKYLAAKRHHGQALFDKDLTIDAFTEQLKHGSKIRSTTLTDNFTFQDYQAQHDKKAIPLFAISPKGRLHIFTENTQPSPSTGWNVVSLIAPSPTS